MEIEKSIQDKLQQRKENIMKGVVECGSNISPKQIIVENEIEKARNVGETKVGKDGITRVWTQLSNGKFDWRRKTSSNDKDDSKKSNNDLKHLKKIQDLPKGKIFEDAKNIESLFKKTDKSWSEVAEIAQNKNDGKLTTVNIKDIRITQPNIQLNKVVKMLDNLNETPVLDVVKFKNGEMAIHDGHHRLTTHLLNGDKKVKVNLISEDSKTSDKKTS